MHARYLALCILLGCGSGRPATSSPSRGGRTAPPPREKQAADIVPASALPSGACDDATLLTLDELAEGKGANERIAIDVVPKPRVICTQALCMRADGPADGCCNDCFGGYRVIVREPEIEPWLEVFLQGLGGCRGGECNVWCEPFGRDPTTRYRFVGFNTFKPARSSGAIFHKVMFDVEKYCVL